MQSQDFFNLMNDPNGTFEYKMLFEQLLRDFINFSYQKEENLDIYDADLDYRHVVNPKGQLGYERDLQVRAVSKDKKHSQKYLIYEPELTAFSFLRMVKAEVAVVSMANRISQLENSLQHLNVLNSAISEIAKQFPEWKGDTPISKFLQSLQAQPELGEDGFPALRDEEGNLIIQEHEAPQEGSEEVQEGKIEEPMEEVPSTEEIKE